MLAIDEIREYCSRITTATDNSTFKAEGTFYNSTWNYKIKAFKRSISTIQDLISKYYLIPGPDKKTTDETERKANTKFAEAISYWMKIVTDNKIQEEGVYTPMFRVVQDWQEAVKLASVTSHVRVSEIASRCRQSESRNQELTQELTLARETTGRFTERQATAKSLKKELKTANQKIGELKTQRSQLLKILFARKDPQQIVVQMRDLMSLLLEPEPEMLDEENDTRRSHGEQSRSRGREEKKSDSSDDEQDDTIIVGRRLSSSSASASRSTRKNSYSSSSSKAGARANAVVDTHSSFVVVEASAAADIPSSLSRPSAGAGAAAAAGTSQPPAVLFSQEASGGASSPANGGEQVKPFKSKYTSANKKLIV